ncbi:hypothetical protein KUCAC02_020212, partial [Chaenocephalus aceratus]
CFVGTITVGSIGTVQLSPYPAPPSTRGNLVYNLLLPPNLESKTEGKASRSGGKVPQADVYTVYHLHDSWPQDEAVMLLSYSPGINIPPTRVCSCQTTIHKTTIHKTHQCGFSAWVSASRVSGNRPSAHFGLAPVSDCLRPLPRASKIGRAGSDS